MTTDPIRRARRAEAFFGRRRGKTLRHGQAEALSGLMERLNIALGVAPPEPLAGLFSAAVETVRIEIGFGGGEHLLHRVASEPESGFIGVERKHGRH